MQMCATEPFFFSFPNRKENRKWGAACYLSRWVTFTLVGMTETELLQRFRNERSEEAFAELVQRYADLVYSVARRRLSNASLAEEVAQLVFIRLAKAPPKVTNHSELVGWLHRATLNVAIDTWRSEARRRTREEQAMAMEPKTTATNTNVVWEEIAPKVDEAMNQLKDGDRQVLLLRFFGRKTMRDVGVALGISEDAAKMRVSRAIERLRHQLGAGATCTAAVLDVMLAKNGVSAAPASLSAGLTKLRIPMAINAVEAGPAMGVFKAKLVAGLVLLGLVIWYALTHFGQGAAQEPREVVQTQPSIEPVSSASKEQPQWSVAKTAAMLPGKAGKTVFHVLESGTGSRLVGARVHFAFFGPGGEGEGHDTLTDANGDAVIAEPDNPAFTRGPNVFLSTEGHVPKSVNFYSVRLPAEYTIELDPAMVVGGIVVDEEGQPVPDVQIMVQTAGNRPGQRENIDFQTCPVTNHEDGTWTCSYIPRDCTNELHLILKKPGFAVTFPIVPMQQVDRLKLMLVINRGFTITGQVTDSSGQPIRDAEINTLDGIQAARQAAITDEKGCFSLAGVVGDPERGVSFRLPPVETNGFGAIVIRAAVFEGPLHSSLAVQARGYASQTATIDLTNLTNVIKLELIQGKILRGIVRDEGGHPIINAVVRTDFDFKNQRDNAFKWSTHTDENGRFEWDSAPVQEICYWFEADGYKAARGVRLTADDSEHSITLQQRSGK